MLNESKLVDKIVELVKKDSFLNKSIVNKKLVKRFAKIFGESIILCSKEYGSVGLNGFGKFEVHRRKQFVVKPNKFTDLPKIVPERDSIKFKPSNKFKKQLYCGSVVQKEQHNISVVKRPIF